MQEPETQSILPTLLTAATVGAAARVIVALHAGERKWPMLLIEAAVGALIGQIISAAFLYWNPHLHIENSLTIYIMAGAAGFGGAMGVRLLDTVTKILQRHFGA